MIILKSFKFPSEERETDFLFDMKRTCYDVVYPFGILTKHRFERIDFAPITILCGGNGSGKSTALNIIAERLGIQRFSLFNSSGLYTEYLKMCEAETAGSIPAQSRIITSDDVFDYMLDLRTINNGIDSRREELFKEYVENRNSGYQLKSLKEYEKLRRVNQSRKMSQSQYVRQSSKRNIRERSNGESALIYFQEKITENALYLLDEPENSLSAEKQLELVKFLVESARYFGCQFVIATHSPFLLSIPEAKIYDLDEEPVTVKRWNELSSVKTYYRFFREHRDEFE